MTSGVDTRDLEEKLPKQQQDIPGETNEMSPRPDHGEYSYKGSGKLEGRTAIITGGDSGIGRAVAVAFAREGADIVLAYLNEHDDARETAGWVERPGRRAILVPGDVGDESHDIEISRRPCASLGELTFWSTTLPTRPPSMILPISQQKNWTGHSGRTSTVSSFCRKPHYNTWGKVPAYQHGIHPGS